MMLAEATGKANKVKMNNVSLIKYINDLSTSTLPGPGPTYRYDVSHVCFFFFQSLVFFFFLPFLAAKQHMEFLGQGSDPSHSCYLSRSCGNAGAFNPPCPARDQARVLALQRRHQSCCATAGTPTYTFLNVLVSHREK